MAFTEDLSAFFGSADFAETAQWGALFSTVIVDVPTEDVLGGKVSSNEYMVTMPTAEFPGISYKDSFSILTGYFAGSYVVREVKTIEDGSLKAIKASRV